MSNVPCRMSNSLDQLTRRPNWVSWSFGQIHMTFDMGHLTFDIGNQNNGSIRMFSHDMTGKWDSPSDHDGFFRTSSHLSGASPGRSDPPPPSCGTSDTSAHNAGARSLPTTPRFFLEKPDAFSSACQSSHASILDRLYPGENGGEARGHVGARCFRRQSCSWYGLYRTEPDTRH